MKKFFYKDFLNYLTQAETYSAMFSEHARHFSNWCHIYIVSKVVHGN